MKKIVTKFGGSSLAELALFGKAAVLIPYPFASENHQRANAGCFADVDAGIVLDTQELSPHRSREILLDFIENPSVWQQRAVNAKRLAKPYAADDMLDKIEEDLA